MQGLGVEVLLTAVLMFVITSVATDTRAVGQLAAIAIGGTVALDAALGWADQRRLDESGPLVWPRAGGWSVAGPVDLLGRSFGGGKSRSLPVPGASFGVSRQGLRRGRGAGKGWHPFPGWSLRPGKFIMVQGRTGPATGSTMHWSKSRHTQYSACPRQFFYEVIAGPRNAEIARLAESTGMALRRHETVRQLISAIVRSPTPEAISLDRLLMHARQVLATETSDDYEVESELSIVQLCLENFMDRLPQLLESAKILHVHQGDPVEFVYDGLTMMALPELVLGYPDKTEILCWKTGSSRYKKTGDGLLLAGGLTCWARSAMKIVSQPIVVREVFLREDFYSNAISFNDDELRDFVRNAKATRNRYSSSAKIRDFPARPGDTCRFCPFKQVCPEYGDHFELDYGLSALTELVLTGDIENEQPPAIEKKTLFLSHASEDKERLVRPVARALDAAGISYWLDEAEIFWGDSLTRKINEGLRRSTHVVVFISDAFIGRGWPEAEFGSAMATENSERVPRLLPIVDAEWSRVAAEYPLLRDKKHVAWSAGIDSIIASLKAAIGRSSG